MENSLYKEIPESGNFKTITEIKKGWSADKKYCIETVQGDKLLLRLSEAEIYESKKKEYEIICKFSGMGFEMSKPVNFGLCGNGAYVYMLLKWVEGRDLEQVLPGLSKEEQYLLGTEAGKILRKIHSIKVPKEERPVTTKVEKKKVQLQKYKDSKVRIPGDEPVLRFVSANFDKIWTVPPVYQHGDFHPGNLILTPEHKIGVIDFNRWEIGDPYEEFYKLQSFGREISIPYCIGQIDGYFDGNPDRRFWEAQALYVAHASLYSIKWAEPFGKADVEKMVERCYQAMRDYDNFLELVPVWYRKKKET